MLKKFQNAMMILGLVTATLSIVFSKSQHDSVLHLTIIFWIMNCYLTNRLANN